MLMKSAVKLRSRSPNVQRMVHRPALPRPSKWGWSYRIAGILVWAALYYLYRLWVLPERNSLPQEFLTSMESLKILHIHSGEAHDGMMQASNSGRIDDGAAFELMSKGDLLAHALLLESMLQKYGASVMEAYRPLKVPHERPERYSRPELVRHAQHLEGLLINRVGFLHTIADQVTLPSALHASAETANRADRHVSCNRTELSRWCKAFEACDAREVAIVGNGPLSAQQRSELNSGRFQVILRFNFLNNRLPGEQMDVWVMRWGDTAKLNFWGLSQMTGKEGAEALQAATSLWLMAELQAISGWWKATQALYRAFPQVRNMDHEVLSPLDTKHFPGLDRWPGTDKKQPSTGWLGTVYALECARPFGATVHMYGFNWHDKHGDTHPSIQEEYGYFQKAEQNGLLIIHPTACAGLRSCGKDAKMDARRDCRIVGTNVLGKDEYKCTGSSASRGSRLAPPGSENRAAVQKLMKQLFPSAEASV